MPKSLSLFGRYVRRQGKYCQWTFRKYQITKLIPNKAAGRVPSASSQTGLYHNDDFNAYWKVSAFNTLYRKRTSPFAIRKDFKSEALNTTVRDLRVTPSALYAVDDKGGFDDYILRTPPEDMRSNTGEKLRNLIHYYQANPDIRAWSLPWKVLMRKRDQADPVYARYRHELKKSFWSKRLEDRHARFSPYFLPSTDDGLFPQRDVFVGKSSPNKLDLWWKKTPELESAFRERLTQAKSFEEAHPDHREPGAYRKGEGMGGGGKHNRSPRPRSKTYRSRVTRSY